MSESMEEEVEAPLIEIPVVDLADVEHEQPGSRRRQLAAAQLSVALQKWRTCHVINHGIPQSIVRAAQEYFHLPLEEKMQYAVDVLEKRRRSELFSEGYFKEGFMMIGAPSGPLENLKPAATWTESLLINTRPLRERNENNWPPMLRDEINQYGIAIRALLVRLLELLSESLGLPSSSFMDCLQCDDAQLVGMLLYPNCPEKISLPGHTDTTVLTTLLSNEVPGLEFLLEGDKWVTVKPLDGALIIQTGVFLEVISNGIFKAIYHRVKSKGDQRLSMVCSYRLPNEATVEPCSNLTRENGVLYKPVNIGQYMNNNRLAGVKGFNLDPYKKSK